MEKFILNDENKINSYGFVVLNSGGKFERFNANPVMLSGHNNDNVIGNWQELSNDEDGTLKALPTFDSEDDAALKIQGKVERGYLKGASIGFIPISMDYILRDGVKVLAVTEWELLEASIVSVPSNANCVRLYNAKGEQLTAKSQIQLAIQEFTNKIENTTMNKILLTAVALTALGMNADTITDEAASAAILKLAADKKTAEDALTAFQDAQANGLVEAALSAGRITADKKTSFLNLAKANFDEAKEILEAIPARKQLAGTEVKGLSADRAAWNFRQWQKEDPEGLKKLRVENFDAYEALRTKYGS